MPPHKRDLALLSKLSEPVFTATQRKHFQDGIDLFNAEKYWYAHEAWEDAWKDMGNEPKDDAEIFLRGLVQLAAGLHCLTEHRKDGADRNFDKAYGKLRLAAPVFLNLNVQPLLAFIDAYRHTSDMTLRCKIETV
jgi:predicted metal-dependent hydrolase